MVSTGEMEGSFALQDGIIEFEACTSFWWIITVFVSIPEAYSVQTYIHTEGTYKHELR